MNIQEYEFRLDNSTLEIFPSQIIQDPTIVFHGTCTYHSDSIETNGFLVNTPAYNLNWSNHLCTFLESDKMSRYDIPKGFFKWTIAQSIRHYMYCISTNDFRISFGALSGEILFYTEARTKGGQAIIDIRDAKDLVDQLIATNNLTEADIPGEVSALFTELDLIDRTQAIIYAVKLPEDLSSVSLESGKIHSSASIPLENVVGKIVIPTNFKIPFSRQEAEKKRDEKLMRIDGIGRIIHNFHEDNNR